MDDQLIIELYEKRNTYYDVSLDEVIKSGNIYTKVDGDVNDKVVSYVIIYYDHYTGYISFEDLTEEEIHEVLDCVNY